MGWATSPWRALLSVAVAMVAAEYAAMFFLFLFDVLIHGLFKVGASTNILGGAYLILMFVPLALAMTWKIAAIVIVIGEFLGRPLFYYPIGGGIAAHWIDYSVVAMDKGSWLTMTLLGSIAGYIYWFVRTRCDFPE